MDFQKLDALLSFMTDTGIIPALSAAVGKDGKLVYSAACGHNSETGTPITDSARFDVASLTKIYTGVCFLRLVEKGLVGLDDPMYLQFPEMDTMKPVIREGAVVGVCDEKRITWRHALTHTSGFGWTEKRPRPSLPGLDRGLEVIFDLPLLYMPGERIVYSDIPIILMGKAIEKLTGMPLDEVVRKVIIEPLSLKKTGYRRVSSAEPDRSDIMPTEYDSVFRHQRVWGVVHDENAFQLDGVAGHAGIFSSAADMCRLAMALDACLTTDGLLKRDTAREMVREQTREDGDRRGLLWQLSGREPESYTLPLSDEAYGHSGFTGCFLWNDPARKLSIVFLSNDIYGGRENRKLFLFRRQILETMLDCAESFS